MSFTCMYVWMDGWMYPTYVYVCLDVCIVIWMDIWMFVCVIVCMDGWMDGWIYVPYMSDYIKYFNVLRQYIFEHLIQDITYS